jgi:hypothetical protein
LTQPEQGAENTDLASTPPQSPRCIIIAGPNGAGKTTFAQVFLPKYAKVVHFVNADLIAGLSPLSPESAAFAAGRLFLKELDRLAYVSRLTRWKKAGYRVEKRQMLRRSTLDGYNARPAGTPGEKRNKDRQSQSR